MMLRSTADARVADNGNVADTDRTFPRFSRSRWLVVWALLCLVAIAAAFVVGTRVRSPWEQAIDNSSARPPVTALVERRVLGADDVEQLGTVSLGAVASVSSRADESVAVVTAVRKAAGEVIAPGESLASVSGRPVIALDLPFPLYRDIVPGDEGDDLRALQESLGRLGLYDGPQEAAYGPVTAAAVRELYRRTDSSPPTAADEARASVEVAEEAVRTADQALTDATRALKRAQEASSTAEGGADAGLDELESAVARERGTRDEAKRKLSEARTASLTPLPMAEIVRVPTEGATVVRIAAVGVELAGDSAEIAALRSGQATVTTRASVANAPSYEVGRAATVAALTDAAVSADGVVSTVGPFQQAATDDGQPPGYDVTLTLADPGRLTDGQKVRITVVDATPPLEGLSVPLIAVRSDRSGDYVLAVDDELGATSSGGTRRIDVTLLGTADGYAVVSGDLAEGDQVLVAGTS